MDFNFGHDCQHFSLNISFASIGFDGKKVISNIFRIDYLLFIFITAICLTLIQLLQSTLFIRRCRDISTFQIHVTH